MNKFPMVIAHRGASNIAPENTLPAFKKAIEIGCDVIELDVHLSKDGCVMVIHDHTLHRTTNGTGSVSDYNLAQLKTLNASKLFPDKYFDIKIPTLEEVFKLVLHTKISLIVELKGTYTELPDKVVSLIKNYNLKDRVTISSYNHDYLKHIKSLNPDIQTEVDFFVVLEDIIKFARRLNVNVLCGEYKYIERMCKLNIKRVKNNKLSLLTYTLDNEALMLKLIKKGVDGIITNRPDLLLKLKADYNTTNNRFIKFIRKIH